MNMQNKIINIFSSCDGNYLKHIPTLVLSIYEHMPGYHVRFFLLHISIDEDSLRQVKSFCANIDIDFFDIRISAEKVEKYIELKRKTEAVGVSPYATEGMFMCLPNCDLPADVDRALYLDAGDVIVSGDFSNFYFSDFKGNIITASKGFASDWSYSPEDLYDRQKYLQMAQEYFNAGSVLFNVELMRQYDISFEYYYDLLKRLKNIHQQFRSDAFFKGRQLVVIDDQGLLGTAFAGHINFYDPKNLGNIITPYNFRPFVVECNRSAVSNAASLSIKSSQAKIIHLLGNKPSTPKKKRRQKAQAI